MDITGLIAVIGAFGIGPAIVYLRGKHKLEERRLELEARTGSRRTTRSSTPARTASWRTSASSTSGRSPATPA